MLRTLFISSMLLSCTDGVSFESSTRVALLEAAQGKTAVGIVQRGLRVEAYTCSESADAHWFTGNAEDAPLRSEGYTLRLETDGRVTLETPVGERSEGRLAYASEPDAVGLFAESGTWGRTGVVVTPTEVFGAYFFAQGRSAQVTPVRVGPHNIEVLLGNQLRTLQRVR